MSTKPALESEPVAVAHDLLRHRGSVAASEAAHVSRRQLHRWFYRHLGIGPEELADLERCMPACGTSSLDIAIPLQVSAIRPTRLEAGGAGWA